MKNKFFDILNEFYENSNRPLISKEYYFFEEQEGIWLLADTTRDYIADYGSLLRDGYMHQNGSKIEWHNLVSVH